ncbi:hypothetical protein D3C76_818300 [compost metagenome]
MVVRPARFERLVISFAAMAELVTRPATMAGTAAKAAPMPLPRFSADFLISAMRFCDSRLAWSSGPVKPPILAIKSRVSVPSDLLAMPVSC